MPLDYLDGDKFTREASQMEPTLLLSPAAQTTAGTLLLTIVLVEFGGLYVLRLVTGRQEATPFQKTFARAGHAHAGVLVSLALIVQIFADAIDPSAPLAGIARSGVPLAAILIPSGYFFSSAGRGATEPNRLIWLIYAGAVALGLGVVALGLGLIS
jgi:hypothetical protein